MTPKPPGEKQTSTVARHGARSSPRCFSCCCLPRGRRSRTTSPELAEESRQARGRIVAVIRPYTSSDDDARDLTTALIGYTFMTLSTGVPVDSEDLHRFVRRQCAIYSVRGRAPVGSHTAPARGH